MLYYGIGLKNREKRQCFTKKITQKMLPLLSLACIIENKYCKTSFHLICCEDYELFLNDKAV